jgi:hypothetical protein
VHLLVELTTYLKNYEELYLFYLNERNFSKTEAVKNTEKYASLNHVEEFKANQVRIFNYFYRSLKSTKQFSASKVEQWQFS